MCRIEIPNWIGDYQDTFGGRNFLFRNTYHGGGHHTDKCILGGHSTYLLDGGTIGVGTPHNIRGDIPPEENNWGGDTAQHRKKKLSCGWVVQARS